MLQAELVWRSLVDILEETTGVPAEGLSPEQSFEDDLGFDSLTIVEIAVMTEQRLGVALPDELLAQLRRLGDVAEFIVSQARRPEGPPTDTAGAAATTEVSDALLRS